MPTRFPPTRPCPGRTANSKSLEVNRMVEISLSASLERNLYTDPCLDIPDCAASATDEPATKLLREVHIQHIRGGAEIRVHKSVRDRIQTHGNEHSSQLFKVLAPDDLRLFILLDPFLASLCIHLDEMSHLPF